MTSDMFLPDLSALIMGANPFKRYETNICMSEYVAYNSSLEFFEKSQLSKYLINKHQTKSGCIRFSGQQFLHAQNHPSFNSNEQPLDSTGLIQENAALKSKFKKTKK